MRSSEELDVAVHSGSVGSSAGGNRRRLRRRRCNAAGRRRARRSPAAPAPASPAALVPIADRRRRTAPAPRPRATRCSATSGSPPGRGRRRLRHAPRRTSRPRSGRRSRASSTGSIAAQGFAVTRDERERLVEELIDEVTGFGPLEPLLSDETITEVMVNGPNHIYIERGGKIQRVDTVFLNDEHVLRIIDRIITPLGRRIDESSPRVDARLPDGSRVNAIIEPLSLVGPVITVRKFSAEPYTVDDLIRVRDGDAPRCSTSCGPASRRGSTSSSRAARAPARRRRSTSCRRSSPNDERIVTIEDAAELQLRQDARRHARVAPAEPRGRGRDHDPRPAAQRDAHAPRPDHRRRVPCGRGARHAPGDDDRPRRLALDRPREHARRTCSAGSRRWS